MAQNSVPDLLALKVCTHSLCLFLQPSQSWWKHQRDLQSPCPDESIQSVDPAQSHLSLLHPVVGQREEKPTLTWVVRLNTSGVRDTHTRTSRKRWWLHRTILKWPRISYGNLSPFPLPRMFLHSTLLCFLRVCSLALAWSSHVGFWLAQPSPNPIASAGWHPTPLWILLQQAHSISGTLRPALHALSTVSGLV